MTDAAVYDDTLCLLGEGPLYHPQRQELFWFDIMARRLHSKGRHWGFDRTVSAAGWVDEGTLLVASDVALMRFDLETGKTEDLCPLEADQPVTRCNDGRADPFGGFWIGTMGRGAEHGAGAIYRFYKGELRQLYPGITIPNAICFSPDGGTAYFADTPTKKIMRQRLSDKDGWPEGEPEVHVDLNAAGHAPDGAVTDQDGRLWSAQWGSGRVAAYDTEGQEIAAVAIPAEQVTCPAFAGAGSSTLYCTSAAVGLAESAFSEKPLSGQTFVVEVEAKGQAEHQVIL
ncbi:SMP-30/gluconolactonase/LRE family protein [Pseudoroseicyclus aestuarii]|uniref:Sugar lactone lactonase YvrE n=1 Tax=Pseudoroseicyclus aestuarii TaxID=1795041 RepID=A0A318SZU8_9RHOB|nr:SMP-30/gluconolactonase/LRE family protein [Pseudoroseicyclus aestuarii]PYE85899.1 sugar lactone lactonase YvrE [Pseudoroseicyclus aestuarii]